jgi:hypothetical protein
MGKEVWTTFDIVIRTNPTVDYGTVLAEEFAKKYREVYPNVP